MNVNTIKTKLPYSESVVMFSIHRCHFVFVCSKLKERISQLDQENTSLTKAHVERLICMKFVTVQM